MAKYVTVTISDKLNANEWKALKAFCKRAEQLANTKLVSGGASSIKGRMRYNKDKGFWFEASSLPPEEQIAEFLMVFRFFYLKKEQTQFLKILAILGKHAAHDEVRQALKMMKAKWNQALFGNSLQIKLNDKQITASILMDLWFNAHYFHSDESKEIELEKLKDFFTTDFAKFMLMDSAYESAKLIFRIHEGLHGLCETKNKKP